MYRPFPLVLTSSPRQITLEILDLCESLNRDTHPVRIAVAPKLPGLPRDCFGDVQRHIEAFGGQAVNGWALWEMADVLVEAEFHAVWRNPNGELCDVSKKPHGEKYIWFLVDPSKVFNGEPVDNVRKPIDNHPLVIELIARHKRRYEYLLSFPTGRNISIPQDDYAQLFPNDDVFQHQFAKYAVTRRRGTAPCVCGSGRNFSKCCKEKMAWPDV